MDVQPNEETLEVMGHQFMSTTSTNTDIDNTGEIHSWGYIHPSTNLPIIILDPKTQETLLSNHERYLEIYLLLQDDHISKHREFYDQYSGELIDFNHWNDIPISLIYCFYLIMLKERFEPNRQIATTLNIWYKSFKEYADQYIRQCNICGMYRIGDSCAEKPWDEPILLSFDY